MAGQSLQKLFNILENIMIQKKIKSSAGINSQEVILKYSPKGIYILMMNRDDEALKGMKIIVE